MTFSPSRGINQIDTPLQRFTADAAVSPRNDIALGINEERCGQGIRTVGVGSFQGYVEKHRKGVTLRFNERRGGFHSLPPAIGHINHQKLHFSVHNRSGSVKFKLVK